MDTKIDLLVLGSRIDRERKRRGLTIEKLAYTADLSKGNLSELLKGQKDPRFSTLIKIAEALDMSVSALLYEIETEL